MKYKDISKQNSAAELERALGEFRENLRRFRFAVSQGKTKGVKAGRETRKDIARVLTRLSQISPVRKTAGYVSEKNDLDKSRTKGLSNGIKRT